MSNATRCDGVTRRDILKLGVISCLGLTLADYCRLEAAQAQNARSRSEVSCILIWLDGGPSHLDTFDPKPDAPSEVRGDFRAIGSKVAGIQVCEHLPRTANVMDRIAVVRSLTHELGNHDTGSHYLLTGHRPTPVMEFPSLGSVVASQLGFRSAVPPYIAVPDGVPSGRSGYLPTAFSPFTVGGDPSRSEYRVQDLDLPASITRERLERRRDMVAALDQFSKRVENDPATASRDRFYEQAYRLLTSPGAKAAFDLSHEPASTRDLYGRNRLGSSCLLARRMVEAGSRFVTVVDRGWDTHNQIFKALPDAFFPGSGKLPALDRAYSGLITDLERRGLLKSTLVVLMGEFGRTPKLNSLGGRDHWPRAGFACFAGAGVRGGQAIGSTDAYGELPADRPVRPEDVSFTMLSLLGINPRTEVRAPDGRPIKIMDDGSFIPGMS